MWRTQKCDIQVLRDCWHFSYCLKCSSQYFTVSTKQQYILNYGILLSWFCNIWNATECDVHKNVTYYVYISLLDLLSTTFNEIVINIVTKSYKLPLLVTYQKELPCILGISSLGCEFCDVQKCDVLYNMATWSAAGSLGAVV